MTTLSTYVTGEPYKHQETAFSEALPHAEYALLMEQGTGKTLVAIGLIGDRYQRHSVRRVLIVAPISVLPFWLKEIPRFARFPQTVVDLTKKDEHTRTGLLNFLSRQGGVQIALINYESTWRFYKGIKDWCPEMIICDESQKIKRYRAKQSKAMHYIGDDAVFKLILTGTPVTQSPMDVWSQYRFLKTTIFGDNFFRFRMRYAIMGGWQHKQVIAYKNLEELAKKAHMIAYRVTKKDALTLPPQVDQELYVELGPGAKTLYRQLKQEFAALLESGNVVTVPIVLTQLLRLQQVTGGFVKNDKGEVEAVSTTKLDELDSLMEDLPTHKKVVIFCRFIAEIKAIQERLTNAGFRCLTLYGETQDRGQVVQTFQEDASIKALVAQIQTAGLGITLTAADTAVFYSTTFGYADYEQARARIHRVGQCAESVTYIHLLVKGSIDEDILAALREKRDVAEYIVDRLKRGTTQKFI